MKAGLPLLLIFIMPLLTACPGPDNKKIVAEAKDFDLSTFPAEWVKLTKTDSGLIIFNSCDAGNLLLSISNNKKGGNLLLHGTQEDYAFDILEILITENETVILKTKRKDSDQLQDFRFTWTDKNKQTGRWIATYADGFTSDHHFVAAKNQKDFPVVNQPCVECWGDECDEMEKAKK